jgi:hypothetical protein
MANLVRIRNIKTGKESDIPADLYEAKSQARSFKFAYKVITRITEPPEVVALRKRMAASGNGIKK